MCQHVEWARSHWICAPTFGNRLRRNLAELSIVTVSSPVARSWSAHVESSLFHNAGVDKDRSLRLAVSHDTISCFVLVCRAVASPSSVTCASRPLSGFQLACCLSLIVLVTLSKHAQVTAVAFGLQLGMDSATEEFTMLLWQRHQDLQEFPSVLELPVDASPSPFAAPLVFMRL